MEANSGNDIWRVKRYLMETPASGTARFSALKQIGRKLEYVLPPCPPSLFFTQSEEHSPRDDRLRVSDEMEHILQEEVEKMQVITPRRRYIRPRSRGIVLRSSRQPREVHPCNEENREEQISKVGCTSSAPLCQPPKPSPPIDIEKNNIYFDTSGGEEYESRKFSLDAPNFASLSKIE